MISGDPGRLQVASYRREFVVPPIPFHQDDKKVPESDRLSEKCLPVPDVESGRLQKKLSVDRNPLLGYSHTCGRGISLNQPSILEKPNRLLLSFH